MSFCDKIEGRRWSSTGCCGNTRASDKGGCAEAHISSCNCQSNVGCLDGGACGGMQPVGTAATGACPGPCQCLEEEIWNSNVPPKPNCRWLNNFAELRRQWSDHGRQQACKCCYGCSRCRTVTSCRPCLSPTSSCSGTILLTSDCQIHTKKCCGSRRLAGGASKSEMAPIDKSSSSNPRKRETGGGCPPPSCTYPSTRYNSANADCSSIASSSSCCSSPCRHPRQASSHWAPGCQHPYVLKSILKKRSCYQCNTNQYCMCQPMPRGCNCPPPIQVDARAAHECSCECPSSPECACPPSERRFPKETIKCPNACLCCPFPRLSPGPTARCHSPYCQSCLPPPCGPCLSAKCRRPVPPKDLCQSNSPCPSCSSCRPVSTAFPCRPPTSCRKLTFCTERSDRPSSPCTGQFWSGINVDKRSENSVYNEQSNNERQETRDKEDRRCTTDYTGSDDKFECNEKCRDLVLNESSVQNSSSKTFINLSETRNPSKSVDPDSHDTSEERHETAFENAADTFEGNITERSSKDSWFTSPTHVLTDSDAKSDCHAFHEHKQPILARLSSHLKSLGRMKDLSLPNKILFRQSVTFCDAPRARVGPLTDASINIPATSTRGIDRRRRNA